MALTRFPETGDGLTQGALAAMFAAIVDRRDGGHILHGFTPSVGSGLQLNINDGEAIVGGFYLKESSSQTVGLTANATNHVYLNPSGTISISTTGTQPSGSILLGIAVTNASAVSSLKDARQRTLGTSLQAWEGGAQIGTHISSDWSQSYQVQEIGQKLALLNRNDGTAWIPFNAYHDGTNWRYRTTGTAQLIYFGSSAVQVHVAASGTAGNVISFSNVGSFTSSGFEVASGISKIGSHTASSWGSSERVQEIGSFAAVGQMGGETKLCFNAYYDGTNWRYRANGTACLISMGAGIVTLQNAASGTAGNIITWTTLGKYSATGHEVSTGISKIGTHTAAAWSSSHKVQEIGEGVAIARISGHLYLARNAYHDGSNWRYTTTSTASLQRLSPSGIEQAATYAADSGTAGNVITWREVSSDGLMRAKRFEERSVTTVASISSIAAGATDSTDHFALDLHTSSLVGVGSAEVEVIGHLVGSGVVGCRYRLLARWTSPSGVIGEWGASLIEEYGSYGLDDYQAPSVIELVPSVFSGVVLSFKVKNNGAAALENVGIRIKAHNKYE